LNDRLDDLVDTKNAWKDCGLLAVASSWSPATSANAAKGVEMSTCANMSHPPSVAGLLLKAGSGDRSAGEQIVVRYAGLVRSVVARFGFQESDVADVVQSTWLRLFTHTAAIRDPEKLGGWLSTTARREALALIRRRQAEIASESVGDRLTAVEPSPEDLVIIDETRAAVRAATDELTGRQKLVVDALFYQPADSYEEVSRRTGLPVGSIGPTRGRTLRRIQQRLCEPQPPQGPDRAAGAAARAA
jgi:RNA polymerase sigma factor (sigma-70 family)